MSSHERNEHKQERAEETQKEQVEALEVVLRDAAIEDTAMMVYVLHADITFRAMFDLLLRPCTLRAQMVPRNAPSADTMLTFEKCLLVRSGCILLVDERARTPRA